MTTEEMLAVAKRREADKSDLLEWTQRHISELIESDLDQIESALKLIQMEPALLKRFADSARSVAALDHLSKAAKLLKTTEEYYFEHPELRTDPDFMENVEEQLTKETVDDEDDEYPDYDAIEGYREMTVERYDESLGMALVGGSSYTK